MKRILIGHRFQDYSAPGSLGILKDVMFVMCFWPKLDAPTSLFAEGSSGIEVFGSPTPRNVLFPEDTVFHEYMADALYPAEQEVFKQFPGRRNMVGLSAAEAQVWLDAYSKAAAELPPTATKLTSRGDCFFLRERVEKSRRTKTLAEPSRAIAPDGSVTVMEAGAQITKIEYDEFVATIDPKDARRDRLELRKRMKPDDFHHISGGHTMAAALAAKGPK